MEALIRHNPQSLQTLTFSKSLRILVLAPHPDDFDAIGVTMRYFHENGNKIHVAVATTGANGVEDSFCTPPTAAIKAEIRKQEQQNSCRFFGLTENHLEFFRLQEDESGHVLETQTNIDRIRDLLQNSRPAMVFLPHWHDSNLEHQRIHAMFRRAASNASYPLVAFLNRDPKTIQMRADVYLEFEKKTAKWKAKLLRYHRSQHQRNLNQRGHGFDERILRVDHESAEKCALLAPYAEVFELEFFGADDLEELTV